MRHSLDEETKYLLVFGVLSMCSRLIILEIILFQENPVGMLQFNAVMWLQPSKGNNHFTSTLLR